MSSPMKLPQWLLRIRLRNHKLRNWLLSILIPGELVNHFSYHRNIHKGTGRPASALLLLSLKPAPAQLLGERAFLKLSSPEGLEL